MEVFKGLEIIKTEGGKKESVIDKIVEEFLLEVYLNNSFFTRFVCTPRDLEALVCGHLFAEGIIRTYADIESFSVVNSKAEVVLKQDCLAKKNNSVASIVASLPEKKTTDQVSMVLSTEDLFASLADLDANSPLFTATGGVHGCLLAHIDGRQLFTEDVGRHNAIDKALGWALMEGWNLAGAYLVTGARISKSIMIKALNCGLPLIVSRSAPTVQAVELARKYNLTLCGFARGQRMNIYSIPERIKNT